MNYVTHTCVFHCGCASTWRMNSQLFLFVFCSDVWSLGCVLYELCTLRHPVYFPSAPMYLESDCGPLPKYCQCIIVSSSSDSDVGLFSQHPSRLIIVPSSRHQAGRAWSSRCAGGHTLPSPIICPTSCSIWLSRCLRQTRETGRLCTPSWLLTGRPNSCVCICLPR